MNGRRDVDAEWKVFVDRPMPQNMGRIRVTEWEIRNLRMVANVRRASASIPGGRLLVIVGADHKAWFDTYLEMMCDLTIVNAATVLRPM